MRLFPVAAIKLNGFASYLNTLYWFRERGSEGRSGQLYSGPKSTGRDEQLEPAEHEIEREDEEGGKRVIASMCLSLGS